MTTRRNLLGIMGGAALALTVGRRPYMLRNFDLNLQSFLPAQATIPSQIIDVWADKIEAASGDRVAITRILRCSLAASRPN